jgi:hypothetical protein
MSELDKLSGQGWRFPWEYDEYEQKLPKFLKNKICEIYLVNAYDPDAKFVDGYGHGYDFTRYDDGSGTETRYAVRASRLTANNKFWTAKLEPSAADYILFFGFRSVGKVWGDLEFCLELPMKGYFKNKNKINISDDPIVLEAYGSKYSVEPQILSKMKEVMNTINNHDGSKLVEYLPAHIRNWGGSFR